MHPTITQSNAAATTPQYHEHRVPRGAHHLHVREYPGEGPAIVLMHGFPDNLHLYDYLIPHLAGRHIVVFDFLGWGESDKPVGYAYTSVNQGGDLDAVIAHLALDRVVLVAHDASGPPAIDWALDHPERVAALVLLNTYYSPMPGVRPPEAIFLFSTPFVRTIARAVSARFDIFRRMYYWQVGGFIRDAAIREALVPLLYRQFGTTPSAKPAFFRLNEDLLPTIRARAAKAPMMRAFTPPVRIIFGARDRYLSSGAARRFHALFPASELFLLPEAGHFVQVDEPEEVARLIHSIPTLSAPDHGVSR